MVKPFLRKNAWIFCVGLSAWLTYFSSPPSSMGAVMLVGLIPLFVAFDTAPSWKAAAFRGWLYALLFHAAVAWWAAAAVHEFTHWPWAAGYAIVFALSAFEHGYWAVIAGLRHVLHKRFGVRPIFWTPIAFMAMDAAWPKFFPCTMGNSLYSVPWLKQGADLIGTWGLSGLMVAIGEVGAILFLRSWPRLETRRHAIAVLILAVAASGYSYTRYVQVEEQIRHPEHLIRMGLVQPNIGSLEKVHAETGTWDEAVVLLFSRYFKMSVKALEAAPDLIVWPETAFPGHYHPITPGQEKPQLTQVLDEYVNRVQTPLMMGGYDSDGDKHYNAAFLIQPSARGPKGFETPSIQRYHKRYLFGPAEKIPFIEGYPEIKKWFRSKGHGAFSEGEGAKLFDFNGFRLAPAICGEGLYPAYMRKFAELGAQLFVNLTNDSWFGGGRESEIHLQVMAFRSIETRRPTVRVTNTGHTVVIDIDGSFRMETPLDVPRVEIAEVPIYPDTLRSPYVFWGDTWLWIGGLWAAGVWCLALIRYRRRLSPLTSASGSA